MSAIYRHSALEIRDMFLSGQVTAVQIVQHFLNRIKKHDEKLGCFLKVLETEAYLQAEELDKKRKSNKPLGKLAGIPIGIKDNMHIRGQNTTCASQILKNYKAPFSATAVRLMEEEDALFIGKTNLDEFAMGSSTENSSFFPSSNPWGLDRVPGGSSGGSSAAVAARLCPIATGSDTGGSIRQPASFCNLVGFKPTYGRVSRYGLVAFGSSLDQIGPLTTTVQDSALIMEVIGRHCPYDATCLDLPKETYSFKKDLAGVQFGVPYRFLENLDDAAKNNFYQSIEKLKSLGATIVEVDLDVLKHSIAVYYILATAEASTNLARFDGIRYGLRSSQAKTLDEIYDFSRKEGFGREVKQRIMLGTYVLSAGYQDAYYKKAQKVRTLTIDAFEKAFETCDAIIMPTTTSGAFLKGSIQDPVQMYLQDIFTISANLAGLPAVSVPSGFTKENLPLGLQILGPQLRDVSVLQYAYAFEQIDSFHKIIPPLFDDEVM